MTREIRITIDDEEVFERMKRRKNRFDLSWEEVLRRGLGIHGTDGSSHSPWHDWAHDWGHTGGHGWRMHGRWSPTREDAPFGSVAIEREGGEATESGFKIEIDRLGDAEDALLRFDGLDDVPGAQVPLRVTLEASTDGLAVDVAAVRQGRDVSDMNRFASPDRKRVVTALARGETAELRLTEGESYRITPVLSWSTDADGHPTVVDVEITDVVMEDEE